jgi:alkylation response protein AidB-like acyl-CoA dehydrogenase
MEVVTTSATDLAEYRAHIRRFIAEHRPPGETREGHRAPRDSSEEAGLRSWYRALYAEQIVGGAWPVEWGGNPDHSPLHDVIAIEELLLARAPRPLDQVQLASHVILQFGSPVQKADYLPRIRSGEDVWCQLFSEPGAGSDLAGIATRAIRSDNGTFVLRGQKTWTTDGHWADMGLALARTGSNGSRHRGLTAFLIPMTTPGVSVVPLTTIGGAHEFNEVFLDDVILAPSAILGQVDSGWSVAMAGLEAERFGVGGSVVLLTLLLDDLVAVARSSRADEQSPIENEHVLSQIIELAAEAEAAITFVNDYITRTTMDRGAGSDAPIGKLLYSETYNRIARYGVQLMAEHPATSADDVPAAQRLRDAWLWSRALTISGGSSEIMRNILAKQHLGLPAERHR